MSSAVENGPISPFATPSLNLARALSCTVESLGTISPLDLFTAQLDCDSSEARVDAMRRLSIVANAIGLETTVTQLIPYLVTNIAIEDDEEDEVLLILAEQLGTLVPSLIPGYRALPILPILEQLAGVEETVVREKAVESINKIVPVILLAPSETDGDQQEAAAAATTAAPALVLAMAKRLTGADWFTSKVSAAGILPVIYSFFNALLKNPDTVSTEEAKRELRILYKDLSEDDTPMVRRSAARNLGKFVEAVADLPQGKNKNVEHVVSDGIRKMVTEDMIPIFHTLSQDEQDSVKLLAVVAAGSVGRSLGSHSGSNAQFVWPVVRSGCTDLSWRVRNNMAKEFANVACSMGFDGTDGNINWLTEVFLCFSGLLQDAEAEVRGAAVINIARMTQLGGTELFNSHIAPHLPSLSDDPVMEVRSRLAQTLMDCCSQEICTCLTDQIILQVFRPLLENFLNDEFPEVQLHILTKLSCLSHLLSKMDVVVNTVVLMTKAQNWRVREATGQLLPHLAEAMGVQFFEDNLLQPWLNLLLDQVADVRSSSVMAMSKLLRAAGPNWIQEKILPNYQRMYEESHSYLTRITIIRSYAALAEDESLQSQLLDDVLERMLRGLNDPVPNVRMVAATGLSKILKLCEDDIVNAKIKPALEQRITEDEDDDCRFFSQLTLDGSS